MKTVAQGSSEVKTEITGSDKAIGYVGFSYAESEIGCINIRGRQSKCK